MDSLFSGNGTVIGADGVLRSAAPADESDVPDLRCPYGKFVLDRAEEQVAEGKDRELVVNADLGEIFSASESDKTKYKYLGRTLKTILKKCGNIVFW